MNGDALRLERELFVRALMPNMHGDGAARLAAVIESRDVAAETLLFRQGEPPTEFFFVVEGQVVLEAEGLPDWVFADRSLVGMVDMTANRPHRRNCRTTRPTRLLVGRASAWFDLLTDDAVMGETAVYSFAERLHTSWLELGHLLPPEPIAAESGLRPPLAIHERTLALRDTPLLSRASTQATASLAQVAEELTFPAGAEIFARGAAPHALYAVVSGVVLLRSESERVVRVGPQRFLMSSASLCGRLGDFSAQAESSIILLKIRVEDYYDQAEEHPELTRAAMSFMALELERLMDLKPPVG